MSTSVLLSNPTKDRTQPVGRQRVRLAAVAVAIVAALAIWVIPESALGIDLRAPAFDGSSETLPVQAQDVLLVSALLSVAGWGLIAVLERVTANAGRVWLAIAVVGLVLSLGTPLVGTGVSVANRIVLVLMHVAVGGILIPALYRSSPRGDTHA